MTSHLSLTAVFETVEDGWVQARVRELPAVITVGRTLDEARALLGDAVVEYLKSLADEVPADEDVTGLEQRDLLLSIEA